MRHTDSLMPANSSALCQAMACWYTLSVRVPSRSSRRAGRSVMTAESYSRFTYCADMQRLVAPTHSGSPATGRGRCCPTDGDLFTAVRLWPSSGRSSLLFLDLHDGSVRIHKYGP